MRRTPSPPPPPLGGGLCPTSARCAVRLTSQRTEATRRRERARRKRFLRARQRPPFCLCAQGGHGDRSPFFFFSCKWWRCPSSSGSFVFPLSVIFPGDRSSGEAEWAQRELVEGACSRRLRGPGNRVSTEPSVRGWLGRR